jgi:hypothetical protein
MTLKKHISAIKTRNAKIQIMLNDGEPQKRVDHYAQISRDAIRSEYLKDIAAAIERDKARQKAIVDNWSRSMPNLNQKAQSVTVDSIRVRSMSLKQLTAESQKWLSVAPGLQDADYLRVIASELRNRNQDADADHIAVFIESANLDKPYIHTDEWRTLDKRINRFGQFAEHCIADGTIVTADDPEVIDADADIITDMDKVT